MEKREFRRLVRERFKALSEEQKLQKSRVVVDLLREILASRRATVIAFFSPLPDEVQIGELVEELAATGNCRVVLPRVLDCGESARMEFYDYTSGEMSFGAYGILEPQGNEPCAVSDIDLMILPGVAFDSYNGRLGRGKGFYDRYLAREGFRAECIGVCFDFQIFEQLPVEPHDRVMDMVVSNNS